MVPGRHLFRYFVLCYRYWLVKDIVDGPENIFQVNYTPMFLHDVLQLKDTWIIFSIISGIILFICICLFLALRQRIKIAIKMIEHGSKAVSHMLCALFFPVLPFFLHICVIGWFLVTGMHLASMSYDKQYSIFYDKDQLGIFHLKYEDLCNQYYQIIKLIDN